jgi:hypothetical protein
MVLTWGFRPDTRAWPTSARFKMPDLPHGWFDGNRDAAFRNIQQRTDHPGTVQDWRRQLQAIDEAWPALLELYGERTIEVVRAGGSYVDPGEIFSRMFPSRARAGSAFSSTARRRLAGA